MQQVLLYGRSGGWLNEILNVIDQPLRISLFPLVHLDLIVAALIPAPCKVLLQNIGQSDLVAVDWTVSSLLRVDV